MSGKIRAVVINLDSARERLRRITALATEAGIKLERLPAVNGRDPALSEIIARHRLSGVGPEKLSDTDMACMLSHRAAWQLLIDSHENWLAVFEDDVHFGRDISSLLEESWIPENVSLIKLESFSDSVRVGRHLIATRAGRSLHILGGSNMGTAGYIISRRCAHRLLGLTERVDMPVDSIMFDQRRGLMQQITVHQIVPAAVVQEFVLANFEGRLSSLESCMKRSFERVEKKNKFLKKIKRLPTSIRRKYISWRVGVRGLGPKGRIPFI